MMATRNLRSTFRLGIAKSYAFELVATRPTQSSPSPPSSDALPQPPATTHSISISTSTSTSTSNHHGSIVLAPSSFTSAGTLNAALDKHIQEGHTVELWVPASALCTPSELSEGGSSPLLVNGMNGNTNAQATLLPSQSNSSTTETFSLVSSQSSPSQPSQSVQLLAEWQSQGIESVAARDLGNHADPGTHLPEDLVQKMSPHHQSKGVQTKLPITIASQLLVAASTNADLAKLTQALLQADPNDECAAHGASPLHLLAATHAEEDVAIECMHVLLEAGAAIDKRASNGSTPLHWAAGNGNIDIAEALLECGADPSTTTFTWFRDVFGKHSGQTPLHWAAESGHGNIVKMIADRAPWVVGSTDERGSTSSALALREAKFDVHAMLMEREEEPFVLLRAKLEGCVAVPIV